MKKIQKQEMLTELYQAVVVRDHVARLVDGPRGIVTKPELSEALKFISYVDKKVLGSMQTLMTALEKDVTDSEPDKKSVTKKTASKKTAPKKTATSKPEKVEEVVEKKSPFRRANS